MAVKKWIFTFILFFFTGCASTGGYYSYKFPEPPSYPYPATVFIIERYPYPLWWDDWLFYGRVYFYIPVYQERYILKRRVR